MLKRYLFSVLTPYKLFDTDANSLQVHQNSPIRTWLHSKEYSTCW